MRRVCMAASIVLAASGSSAAQSADRIASYRKAIADVQRGNVDAAVARVASWSGDDFKPGIDAVTADPREWRLAEAAAMLHLELVLSGRAETDAAISRQIALAEPLVAHLKAPRGSAAREAADIAAFQERWFELAGSIYFAMTAPGPGRELAERGLGLVGPSARLEMSAGIGFELQSHVANGNLHDAATITGMPRSPSRTGLVFAERRYRRALELDPTLAEARLRLGRVLTLLKEPKDARSELQSAAAAGDPRIEYLARLFLGAIDEYEHDLSGARREYEAALAIVPRGQAALVALSFVAALAGDESAARSVAARVAASRDAEQADPWSAYQNGAVSESALTWLRARVRP